MMTPEEFKAGMEKIEALFKDAIQVVEEGLRAKTEEVEGRLKAELEELNRWLDEAQDMPTVALENFRGRLEQVEDKCTTRIQEFKAKLKNVEEMRTAQLEEIRCELEEMEDEFDVELDALNKWIVNLESAKSRKLEAELRKIYAKFENIGEMTDDELAPLMEELTARINELIEPNLTAKINELEASRSKKKSIEEFKADLEKLVLKLTAKINELDASWPKKKSIEELMAELENVETDEQLISIIEEVRAKIEETEAARLERLSVGSTKFEAGWDCLENTHARSIDLICEVLWTMGYEDGIMVFQGIDRSWAPEYTEDLPDYESWHHGGIGTETPITPDNFKSMMEEVSDCLKYRGWEPPFALARAEVIMCEVLEVTGYEEGVKVFRRLVSRLAGTSRQNPAWEWD